MLKLIAGWILVLLGVALGGFGLLALAGPPQTLGLGSAAQLLALQTQMLVLGSTSLIVGTILLTTRRRD